MPRLERVRKTSRPVKGFRVSGVDGGVRTALGKDARPDLALIVSDTPAVTAGVFTLNLVKAAPVLLDMERLTINNNGIRAVLVNTGSANACTGQEGFKNAEQSAVWVAQVLDIQPQDVLVMSTGVIGLHLPMDAMKSGIPQAAGALRAEAWDDAATAIMTTDIKPKLANIQTQAGVTIMGIAKGAGMIAPNMATMLSIIATDAKISQPLLQRALTAATEQSFNNIVVDGDMSTNDTVVIMANGASGIEITEAELDHFTGCLAATCISLAQAIVKDGEGATRFITLQVMGARTQQEAKQIGNVIATSPLVKTAFYGGDANWGRILAAAGRAGVELDPNKACLWFDDLQLVANGTPLKYDERRANAIAAQPEVVVRLDLGLGSAEATIWTCDLTHEYVNINGHYRT